MPAIAILFGALLVPVGLVVFGISYQGAVAETGKLPFTVLIPVVLGVLLIVLGALSYRPHLRKHTMHAAALVGLLGILGGGFAQSPG